MRRLNSLRTWLPALPLALAALTLGCTKDAKMADRSDASGGLWSMQLTTPAFTAGQMISANYTADGRNISPAIQWKFAPQPTKTFVLMIEDPDAPGKEPFVHWLLYNIPAGTVSLPEGYSKPGGGTAGLGASEGLNSKGTLGYTGPEPQPGKAHRYYFEIFALDAPISVPARATKREVVAAMNNHVLAKGQLKGIYQR